MMLMGMGRVEGAIVVSFCTGASRDWVEFNSRAQQWLGRNDKSDSRGEGKNRAESFHLLTDFDSIMKHSVALSTRCLWCSLPGNFRFKISDGSGQRGWAYVNLTRATIEAFWPLLVLCVAENALRNSSL